jgi:Rps23 Pro-64 3,4-dihydroxylase Tpa1-like proline 4-hydroxylase
MEDAVRLLDINPALDRRALSRRFAADKRVQIRDVLTEETAANIHRILSRNTPWGLAWQAGKDGPHNVPEPKLRQFGPQDAAQMQHKLVAAMSGRDYGFAYGQYPMVLAYLEQWNAGGPHDALLELINDAPFLNLVREVTGLAELAKADAQATLYGPGQFLAAHDDSHVAEGWRVAYVLNMCAGDWRPEWGGYLLFYDEEGDVVTGFKPRFNTLNLFLVPQRHAVTFVPPFAPIGRYAITGWFRDK